MLDIIGIIWLILLMVVVVVIYLKKNKPIVYDGEIVVTIQENSKRVYSLENIDLDALESKKHVTFKIVSTDQSVDD